MYEISDLPPELLVAVFGFLDHSDLRNIEKVCVSWQKLLALHFWKPQTYPTLGCAFIVTRNLEMRAVGIACFDARLWARALRARGGT